MNPNGWTAFADEMPARHSGFFLVTNNLAARDAFGHATHVWLVSMVHPHASQYVFAGTIRAEAGEITAFAHPGDMPLRNLTHWRPAVPEEWAEIPEVDAEAREDPQAGGDPIVSTGLRESHGHLLFDHRAGLEYFAVYGGVLRAPIDAPFLDGLPGPRYPIQPYRQAGSFSDGVCPLAQWNGAALELLKMDGTIQAAAGAVRRLG